MTRFGKMSPAQVRRQVAFGAETSRVAGEVISGLPIGIKDSLPEGWDWERVLSLCAAAVAPEGPEPALVAYEERADLLEDGSTLLAEPGSALSRGDMLVTTYSTVRHRKGRHGLVVTVEVDGPIEVLWSPWSHEELPA